MKFHHKFLIFLLLVAVIAGFIGFMAGRHAH
jgi:hypothetical protein